MYLGSELCDLDDNRFAMVGILDGRSSMTSSLNRFGYCFAKAQQDTLLCEAGTVIRGHEFHYSQFTTDLPAAFSLYKERDGERIASWQGGYQVGNTLASYLHVHFAQNERFLLNWFARARENQ